MTEKTTRTTIITVDDVRNWCVNNDLFKLCQSSASEVERYVTIVTNKIFAYIDKEQFKNKKGTYKFPDDLKVVTIGLVESMYFFSVKNDGLVWVKKSTKVGIKADDYDEDYSESIELSWPNPLSFFWIPIEKNSLDILNGYRVIEEEDYWMWGVNIH